MKLVNATRVIVSTVGVLCGISGMEHGFFETLQGIAAPEKLLISAIGQANRFWPGGTEPALTIVPNFFMTGLLAMLAGLLVIIWSMGFVHRKYGSGVFFLLSLFQFLVGGGFAQIFLIPIITAAATQIGSPWKGLRDLLPGSSRHFLAILWVPLLIVFSVTLLASMFVAIFGFPPLLDLPSASVTNLLYILGYSMLGLLPLLVLAGLAQDVNE